MLEGWLELGHLMKIWVWLGSWKKEKPVLHINKWSTCRRFERKKETEASILIIVFFFFNSCVFSVGPGGTIKGWAQRVSFSALYENAKDLLSLAISVDMWHLLSSNAGLQWLGDLIASCLQERPREENGQQLCWLICIYNIALIKNNTVLGPFQDMAMTTPSFPRGFL